MLPRLAAFIVPQAFLLGALLLHGLAALSSAVLWIVSSAVVMTALLSPRSQVFGECIVEAPAQPRVALTFDDGPHPVDTPAILKILEAARARATFFFVGAKAREHPELVRRVSASGHEVEAHSDTHPWWFSLAGRKRTRREVAASVATLSELAGRRPRYFRPPMGHKGMALEKALQLEGMSMVTWSARSFDTISRAPKTIRRRLLSRTRPGGILLLHEGAGSRDGVPSRTVQALPEILAELRDRGLEPVTLSELLEGRR